jgi:hypothetical protein
LTRQPAPAVSVAGDAQPAPVSASAPARLMKGLNVGTLASLPLWSKAPRGSLPEVAGAIRAAGFEAVQGADVQAFAEAGLVVFGSAGVRAPHEARERLAEQRARGMRATTLHLGTGFESDSEALRLMEATLSAAARLSHPVFVETHRATLTQDIWRTLRWIEFFPELRFNADLSHWYTGLEMPYGDFAQKLDRLAPVFERVRFMHGRIGNAGSMQVPVGIGGRDEPHLGHFKAMWGRCFAGFLAHAGRNERLPFLPELLPAVAHDAGAPIYMEYAAQTLRADGSLDETADRWEQALLLMRLAGELFAMTVTNETA